jgi:hypothetical protein
MVAPAEIEKTLRSPPLKTHSGSSFALFVFDSSAMAGTALRLANATKGSYRAQSGPDASAHSVGQYVNLIASPTIRSLAAMRSGGRGPAKKGLPRPTTTGQR